MTDKDVLNHILNEVIATQKQGFKKIETQRLITYLATLKKSIEQEKGILPDAFELAHYSAKCELHKETYKAQCDSQLEMFRSVITSGQNALRAGFLINGGAAVAILAFIANGYGKLIKFPWNGIVDSLIWFTGGVLAIGLATAGTYATQRVYHMNNKRVGDWLNAGVFLIGMVSSLCFCAGAYIAYITLKGLV